MLTQADRDDRIASSIDKGEGNPTQKGANKMAKTKSKKRGRTTDDGDIEIDDDAIDADFVDLDEVDDSDEEEEKDPTEGMLSAKEAAKAIGTDQRSLRKFLRKKSGKVGQGNRWLIDPDDIEELKAEFEAQRTKSSATEEPKPKSKSKSKKKDKTKKKAKVPEPDPDEDDDEEDDDDEFEVLDEIDDL